ncbi:TraR/DksA family transcriptional regulator [Streptomyces sp. NPDC048172]|uniref:TraR/DksA family transcriptional regulator n=1 Tax=Streptomyces sp. NPDC048172 TaxID=3365505 RepID=UPI0037243139
MVARDSAAKKTAAAKKTSHKAAPAKKAATKKAAATKTAAKKTAAKKSVAKKAVAKKAAAKKASPGGEAAPRRATAAGKAAAPVKKTASAAKAAPAEQSAEAADQTTGAKTVAAKKTPAATKDETVPSARAADAASPGELAVRPGEDPWTPEEVTEARDGLRSESERLRAEIAASEEALTGLMRDSGDGAGDDDADTGTKNITREHEMALAANAREMLYQTERALERLDAGTYGLCENCGKAIGKARMQAFPRATLCVECKQKQERR